MKTVHKFPLNKVPECVIAMPKGAQVLHVAPQNGADGPGVFVWALVETNAPKVERAFAIVNTGDPVMVACDAHLATLVFGKGVSHIFDLGEVPTAKA